MRDSGESRRGSCEESDHSPIRHRPRRRTQDSQYKEVRDSGESRRGSREESHHSPIRDQPSRRTQDSQHRDSDSGPSEQDMLRLMRAFVQGNPSMAQLLRNPETVAPEPSAATVAPELRAATVAPQPRPTAAAPKTREGRRPGRGHDGTMDSPAA